jgi:hypothetical protein
MPNDPTVRGKVINHLLHPVPNVPVTIGDDTTTTDSDGEFEIDDVADTYDVQMVVTFPRYGGQGQYAWVYQDLTRRDPTLQVYEGVSLRSGNHDFTPTSAATSTTSEVRIALGSEYGTYSRDSGGAVQTSMSWFGPGTITATGHGLVWDETSGLPTMYRAYHTTSSPIAIADSGQAMWGLDLADNSVSAGTISGSVTSPTSDDRENRVFVQFASGAVVDLITHYGSSLMSDFSYVVPTLPNASVTMAAAEGTAYFGAAAVAHQDGVTAGESGIDLVIPSPPTVIGPAGGTTIGPSTTLSWTAGSHNAFVWSAISNYYYEGIYVVTKRTQLSIPTFSNGWTMRPGDTFTWRVETHGNADSTDDMTGADGFADSFGYYSGDEPRGPRRDSGSYSISYSLYFLTPS